MTNSSFHEVLFPPKIAYGASGGPEFNTSIALSINGFEQRNINWRHARGRWDISSGIKDSRDTEEIQAFFRARHGKAFGFRFRDWSDYKVVDQLIGIGDGNKKIFELIKEYKSGTYNYIRRILKPVEASVKVRLGTVPTTAYSLDATTGVITFKTAPEKGVNIVTDFEFDIPARFDTDQIIVRATGPNRFVADSIPIVEIKLT